MTNLLSIFAFLLATMTYASVKPVNNLHLEEEISKTSTQVDSQTAVQSQQILREALAAARNIKDRADRAEGILMVAPFLEKFGMNEAIGAIDEAATIIPKLPERSSIWKPKNLLFQDPDVTYSRSILRKDELAFQLVELLTSKDPSRALDLALSLKSIYARALGIEMALRAWPQAESEAAIIKIRELAAGSKKEQPSVFMLAALASGSEPHDRGLAQELANRVIRSLSLKAKAYTSDESFQAIKLSGVIILEPMTSIWTLEKAYEVLAKINIEETKQALTKMITNPELSTGNLIAFIRGVGNVNVELAWQALSAIDKNDKVLIHIRAGLLRQIVPKLPENLTTEAKEYLLNFLQTLPEPWKPKLQFGFGV